MSGCRGAGLNFGGVRILGFLGVAGQVCVLGGLDFGGRSGCWVVGLLGSGL